MLLLRLSLSIRQTLRRFNRPRYYLTEPSSINLTVGGHAHFGCLDDEQTALCVRKLVLETEGFRVLTAATAKNALEQMSEHHVDLVIADHLLSDSTATAIAMMVRIVNLQIQQLTDLAPTRFLERLRESSQLEIVSGKRSQQLLLK